MSADYRANNDAPDAALELCKCGHTRDAHEYSARRDAEQCGGCRAEAHHYKRGARVGLIEHKFKGGE